MAKLLSNVAFNPLKGLNNFGKDLMATAKQEVPASHAFRRGDERLRFKQHTAAGGSVGDFSYGPKSISKRRVAAGVLGGYAALDVGYRTVSGGSAYRNRSGEKDLVGIPML
jgi:hypothetical protein